MEQINFIFDELTAAGFDVYHPAQHEGLCKALYIVIKDMGGNPVPGHNKIGRRVVHIIYTTPKNRMSDLMSARKSIISALEDFTGARRTGLETPAIFDPEKVAYTAAIEYEVQKRI